MTPANIATVQATLADLGYLDATVEATATDVSVTLPAAGYATLQLRAEGFDVAITSPTTLLVHGIAA